MSNLTLLKLNEKKLMYLIVNNGLTVEALCKNAGIAYVTYKKMINGKSVKPISVSKIAKALNVKVEDLI